VIPLKYVILENGMFRLGQVVALPVSKKGGLLWKEIHQLGTASGIITFEVDHSCRAFSDRR
jgi:hypothetical protein